MNNAVLSAALRKDDVSTAAKEAACVNEGA